MASIRKRGSVWQVRVNGKGFQTFFPKTSL